MSLGLSRSVSNYGSYSGAKHFLIALLVLHPPETTESGTSCRRTRARLSATVAAWCQAERLARTADTALCFSTPGFGLETLLPILAPSRATEREHTGHGLSYLQQRLPFAAAAFSFLFYSFHISRRACFNPQPRHFNTRIFAHPLRVWGLWVPQAKERGVSVREASCRIFSNASGSYSSNVNLAVENSSWWASASRV